MAVRGLGGGLLVISWVAHPAMVARYALPAAAPAILLPLIVLHRWDRRLPLLVAGLFAVGTAPVWATRADRVKPGFREMVAFLDEYADPQREAIVVAIERTTSPGWEEMDLLGFEYYPLKQSRDRDTDLASRETIPEAPNGAKVGSHGWSEAEPVVDDRNLIPRPGVGGGTASESTSPYHYIANSPHSGIEVLYLRNGMPDGDQPILRDPRALWMVTFLADPMKAIESAGRRVEQIEIEDKVFDQLYFEPYRLIRVAAQ